MKHLFFLLSSWSGRRVRVVRRARAASRLDSRRPGRRRSQRVAYHLDLQHGRRRALHLGRLERFPSAYPRFHPPLREFGPGTRHRGGQEPVLGPGASSRRCRPRTRRWRWEPWHGRMFTCIRSFSAHSVSFVLLSFFVFVPLSQDDFPVRISPRSLFLKEF